MKAVVVLTVLVLQAGTVLMQTTNPLSQTSASILTDSSAISSSSTADPGDSSAIPVSSTADPGASTSTLLTSSAHIITDTTDVTDDARNTTDILDVITNVTDAAWSTINDATDVTWNATEVTDLEWNTTDVTDMEWNTTDVSDADLNTTDVTDIYNSSDLYTSTVSSSLSTSTMTTKSTTTVTTTPNPLIVITCTTGNALPPSSPNSHFQVVASSPGTQGILFYSCNPGYSYVSGCLLYRCAVAQRKWEGVSPVACNRTIGVQCELTIPVFVTPEPPPEQVPETLSAWLVPAATAAAVLLVLLLVAALLLFLYARSNPTYKYVLTPKVKAKTLGNPAAKQRESRSGRWPWKRRTPQTSPQPPGHLGPDGVARFLNPSFHSITH